MPIQSAQTTLNQLYAARTDLLTGKLASYSIGDRNITLLDLDVLNKAIAQMESVVVASETGPVLADMSGYSNQPQATSPFRTLPYP